MIIIIKAVPTFLSQGKSTPTIRQTEVPVATAKE